ncbi:MAG: hypothetical protein WC700_04580 [Gemmatimonadaceae bacterium]|jgi:hypothetical protein
MKSRRSARVLFLLAVVLSAVLSACTGSEPNSDAVAAAQPPAPLPVVGGDTALAIPADTTAGDAVPPDEAEAAAIEREAPRPAPPVAVPKAPTPSVASTPARPSAPNSNAPDGSAGGASAAASGNAVALGEVGSERLVGRISSGTVMSVSLANEVCSTTRKSGDDFIGTVTATVQGQNDATIPSGSSVVFDLVDFQPAANVTEKATVTVRPRSVFVEGVGFLIQGDVISLPYETRRPAMKKNLTKGGLFGALVGAAAGKIAGDSREVIAKKAAAGAAAGAAVGAATADTHVCIKAGTPFDVRLTQTLEMQKR